MRAVDEKRKNHLKNGFSFPKQQTLIDINRH